MNEELDIAALEGTNIIAPSNGVVVLTDNFFYSGNIIVIDHGMGLFTSYSHLHKISVKVGEMVKSGHVIGEVGSTGRVTGPHLHWSVYLTSTRINPETILNFKALNIREAHERPEAMEEGAVPLVGFSSDRIIQAIEHLINSKTETKIVSDYSMLNVSEKVVRIVLSYTDYVNKFVWKKEF